MGDIARRIVAITASTSALELHPLPTDDPWHRQPDITRARALLGWQPQISLDDALAATARYFRARIAASEGRHSATPSFAAPLAHSST
jgi:UDP-glucuronate decarboxylase